jgi:Tfp pilus assembly protein PilX
VADDGGFALPLVLVVILVVMLVAVAGASRAKREARVTRLQEYSEQAFYTAETGFNVARSQLIQCSTPTAQSGTVTFEDRAGNTRPAGQYSVTVVGPDGAGAYTVVSTGTYGQDPLKTTRIVQGRLRITERKEDHGTCEYTYVSTSYVP